MPPAPVASPKPLRGLINAVPCPHCGKRLKGRSGVYTHIKAKHGGKGKAAFLDEPEESMADLFIEGILNRSMGIANDDWLENMLPDD